MPLAKHPVSVTAYRPGIDRNLKETPMQWSQPAFEDMRFGFEITMYISNR
jgi:coenzyme PQQ precursor peptide PqqA